ncbi:Translation initiation factor eIF-2B subunit alpha [Lamellibrachia satsuma]|nr:Translation initiation factor eIF-2B subunit alpha [Lamellibrachia satsuma]
MDMDKQAIVEYFEETMKDDPSTSEAVAAINTLTEFIRRNSAETLVGLRENLKDAISTLTTSDHALVTSISSGCELFLRFITLTALDNPDFDECKKILLERGQMFLRKVAMCRHKISRLAHPFIHDGAVILTHSRSRVVLQVLKEATEAKKHFTVYITESLPDKTGSVMYNDLTDLGIPVIIILDAAIGYIMEKVDFVLVGAEGVVESGGIINKVSHWRNME